MTQVSLVEVVATKIDVIVLRKGDMYSDALLAKYNDDKNYYIAEDRDIPFERGEWWFRFNKVSTSYWDLPALLKYNEVSGKWDYYGNPEAPVLVEPGVMGWQC